MLRSPAVVLFDELKGALKALDDARIDYALVGGLAVAVWGAPRATKDIDLLVQATDLPGAMAAVRAIGFTLEGLPFEFKDGTQLQRVNRVDAAGNLMTIDFMLVDRNLESVWQSRARLPFDGGAVSVVSREALIGMKARAARPQDIMDIQNLRDLDR
jgi:predicted nucleotidyltransferase